MTTTANQEDTHLIVKSIVQQMLEDKFSNDDITFNEITVETLIDHDGEDYIDIRIFYSGNHDVLDPRWTVSLPRLIANEMERQGLVVERVPFETFIDQEEWDEIKDWDFFDELD